MQRTFTGLRNFAGRHGLHGDWFWFHRAGAEYICRGIFPEKSGSGRAGAERAFGFGNGAGAGFYRTVCGLGIWWGLPVLVGALILGLVVVQPAVRP